MAEAATSLDLKEILATEDLSTEKLHEVRREVHCHVDLRNQLEEVRRGWLFDGKVLRAASVRLVKPKTDPQS